MGIFQQFPYTNFHEMNLDQLIKIMREMQDEWESTKAEWASYKDFIDNYFENLDVSDEVLQALRTMAASGELNTIIDPVIIADVTEWLEDNITPTTPAIDASLTIAGAAADAKATGDAIKVVKNDVTTLATGYDIKDWEKGGLTNVGGDDVYRADCRARMKAFDILDVGMTITRNDSDGKIIVYTDNNGVVTSSSWLNTVTIQPGSKVRVLLDGAYNESTPPLLSLAQILAKFTITTVMPSLKDVYDKYMRGWELNVTDAVLASLGVTGLHEFPKNKVYSLNNITTAIPGMPASLTPPYNGCLICFGSSPNGWAEYMYSTNMGKTYHAVGAGSTIRWDSTGDEYFTGFSPNVTDNVLSALGVTHINDFTKNRAYSISNVSTQLGGMPPELGTPYNGCLICIATNSTGWSEYIYSDSTGATFHAIGAGTSIRWDPSVYKSIDQQLASLYGKKVVLVGDSIMYGSHMSDYHEGNRVIITKNGVTYKNNTSTIVWSYAFSNYLTNQYGCNVLNQSFPGCSYNDVTNNLSTLIPSDRDIAICLLGVNDWGNPVTIRTHMTTITNYCKNNNITPIFITPYPAIDYQAELAQIRGYMKEYPKEVADFFSTFNNNLYLLNVNINTLFYDDVHYNDAGQPYIFEAVKKCLHI